MIFSVQGEILLLPWRANCSLRAAVASFVALTRQILGKRQHIKEVYRESMNNEKATALMWWQRSVVSWGKSAGKEGRDEEMRCVICDVAFTKVLPGLD